MNNQSFGEVHKYELSLIPYPTDDVIVITGPFGHKYKFLIDGPGWTTLSCLIDDKEWKTAWGQNLIEQVLLLSRRFPQTFGVEIEPAIDI